MTGREFPEIGEADAWAVYIASLAGAPELAKELRRLDLSDGNEALEDAREFLPVLHEAVERARREN